MSVQDDKDAGQEESQQQEKSRQQEEGRQQEKSGQLTEKPEPDEDDKKKAADMMTAYEDRPTLVLPGTGGMVSGTAVNDWLDDEGNPKGGDEGDEGDTEAEAQAGEGQGEGQGDEGDKKEQIEKDKAWNEELREAAKQENKGEKS